MTDEDTVLQLKGLGLDDFDISVLRDEASRNGLSLALHIQNVIRKMCARKADRVGEPLQRGVQH